MVGKYNGPGEREMKAQRKTYSGDEDFMRVRDFLIDTFALYGRPFNWCLDRWNFCRYHVLPLHTFYNVSYFSVPTQTSQSHRDERIFWEKTNGIWENEAGNIVGVVTSENEEPGETWIQIHPDYTFLYDEMVTYIEEHLADRVGDIGFVKLYVNTGTELERIAGDRGYKKLEKHGTVHSEYTIGELPEIELPAGFAVKSVRDEDDVDSRRMTKAIAFGAGYGPSDWPPASAFEEMQKAPDYREELDLFIVAPNGDYASFCTIWLDQKNEYANLEPVGTRDEYQGMGLGRALLMEGFKRMAAHGAKRSFMDSGNEFYRKIGFRETPHAYHPWIKYLAI